MFCGGRARAAAAAGVLARAYGIVTAASARSRRALARFRACPGRREMPVAATCVEASDVRLGPVRRRLALAAHPAWRQDSARRIGLANRRAIPDDPRQPQLREVRRQPGRRPPQVEE